MKRPNLPVDLEPLMRRLYRVHPRLYLATKGRVGARVKGIDCLVLETTGRRSGAPREVALAYAHDGEDYVLVASNGGSDRPPGWLLNLRDHPSVELQVGAERLRGRARVVERGEARYETLLGLANRNTHWRYHHYQELTSRPIPIVLVTPEPPATP